MRVANFRDDVLWAIAYKLGLDPANEFLTDEGESLVSYINAWVRRTWDSTDFPEWATIKEFTPDARHIVLWRSFPVGAPVPVVLSRPLKVYLVDPRLSPYPIDTRFREWDEGLHVGFDHGATVWIKYLGRAPKFTSIKWDPNRAYDNGELTYSPSSGECYASLVANNLGNDPVVGFLAPLPTGIIQFALPPNPGHDGQKEIIDAYTLPAVDPALPLPPEFPPVPPVGSRFHMIVQQQVATNGLVTYADVAYQVVAGDGWNQIITGLAALLTAAPGMAGWTVTATPSLLKIRLEHASDFRLAMWRLESITAGGGAVATAKTQKQIQVQPFIAAIEPQPGQPQITQITISQDQVKGCTTYTLTFRDPEGDIHTASYYAEPGEGLLQIITGLANTISGSTDPWFSTIGVSIDPVLGTIKISSVGGVSTDASMEPETSTYWDKILFPYALIEPVSRGAYSDALREAGQTDKGMAEEQGAVQEQGDRASKALAPGFTDLTDQRAPAPRYQGKMATPAGGGK